MIGNKLKLNIHIYKEVSCFFIDSIHYDIPVAIYVDTNELGKLAKYNCQISKAILNGIEYITVRDIKAKKRLADIILEGSGKGYSIGFKNKNIFDFRKSNIYYK